MTIDKLISEEEFNETMAYLNAVKARGNKRNYAICRRMILVAANLHSINGLLPYSWFLDKLKKWVLSEQDVDSFMSIKNRTKYNLEYYKMRSTTVMNSEHGAFMNELIDTKIEQLENDNKIKRLTQPW